MNARLKNESSRLTRRRWLGRTVLLAVGGLLAACSAPTAPNPTVAPPAARPTEPPKPAAAPAASAAAVASPAPAGSPAASRAASPSPAASPGPAAAAPAVKPGGPLTKATITEGAHVIGFSPIYLAIEEGYFRDNGLDVELVTVGGGAVSIASVVGGTSLIGLSGGPEAVDAARKGSPIRIVLTTTSEFASNIIASNRLLQDKNVSAQSPLEERVRALKGAKIAITSPGSSTDQLIRFLFKKYGLNPDMDAEIVALRTGPPMLAALQQGTMNAVVLSPPTGEQAVAEGFGSVLINPLIGEIPEIKGHIFHVGSANQKDIQERPQLVRGAIKAAALAERLMRSDKARAKRVLQAYFKELDPKVFDLAYEGMVNAFPPTPIPTRESVQVAFNFTAQFTGQSIEATYEQVVDPKPAEDAVRELGA